MSDRQLLTPAVLTSHERQAVIMLGDGHTAKSIAVELGISVHAVNERLREARRKTGFGSSRELARWMKAHDPQENRDKQIEVEDSPGDADAGARRPSTIARRGVPKEIFAVLTLSAMFAASAILLSNGAPDRPHRVEVAPLLTGTAGDLRPLHARLEAEPVDSQWSAVAERRLESLYSALPSLGFITVRCGSTLCEVTGLIAPEGADRAIDSLKASTLAQAVRAQGFDKRLGTGFRGSDGRVAGGGDDVTWFTTFWSRRNPAAAAPTVVATSPAEGTTVPAGRLTLSVTFDQPMRQGGASFTTPAGDAAFPACDGLPIQSSDLRTFSMECSVQGGRHYVVGFNTPPFQNFVGGISSRPAEPEVLHFQTR